MVQEAESANCTYRGMNSRRNSPPLLTPLNKMQFCSKKSRMPATKSQKFKIRTPKERRIRVKEFHRNIAFINGLQKVTTSFFFWRNDSSVNKGRSSLQNSVGAIPIGNVALAFWLNCLSKHIYVNQHEDSSRDGRMGCS